MSSDVAPSELMAVVLSRALNDGEWGACGAYSAIPMTAFMLARRQHAPNMWWMSGGGGGINPRCSLVDSSSDYRTLLGAEAVFTLEDIVDYEFGGWRRKPNVGLFGGIQVDRRGNVNMVGLGPYSKLTLRGPGTVGLAFGAHFHRTIVYLHRHHPEVLVEEVDYVSAPGHSDQQRRHTRDHVLGPALIATPQAVFDFDDSGLARLASITPGYSEQEVRDHTGFEFTTCKDLGETEPPSPEQLAIIREEIDPHGLLARVDLASW